MDGTAADSCGTGQFTRQIISSLQEDISACLIYGQKNSPSYGTWAVHQNIGIQVFPGRTTHAVKYRSFSEDAPAGSTWNMGVNVNKNNGIFPPTTKGGFTTFAQPVNLIGTKSLYADGGNPISDANLEGTWRLHFYFDVEVPSRGFYYEIDNSVDTHRFACQKNSIGVVEQCKWPNGQEAGL
ncbi:MAG: hypothetical protein ACLGH7_08865 [Actinomycetes bacterium]